MISLKESLIKSNKAGSDRFVFKLYKDAFPEPRISLGADVTYTDYRNDALDMDKVNKLYNKIPASAKIDSKEFRWMRRYPIHNDYWQDWTKLANIILYCKDDKEVKKIVEDVYTKGHRTKDGGGKWAYPFHADVDINIGQGEKWSSLSALPDHTRFEGVNSIKISVHADGDNPREVIWFPVITIMIYMYDESQRREIMRWME